MLSPRATTFQERLAPYTPILTPEILVLSTILLISLGTGIAVVHHALVPAFTGLKGYAALCIATPLYLAQVQGLIFVYLAARNRPRARQLCLALMFLGAIGGYLIFLSDWWTSLHQYLELLGRLRTAELSPALDPGTVLRRKFLPHILIAILKDVLLSAFVGSVLWDALRRRKGTPEAPEILENTLAGARQ